MKHISDWYLQCKQQFTQSHYLLDDMPMKIKIKFLSQQIVSWPPQQNILATFFSTVEEVGDSL